MPEVLVMDWNWYPWPQMIRQTITAPLYPGWPYNPSPVAPLTVGPFLPAVLPPDPQPEWTITFAEEPAPQVKRRKARLRGERR